jgi:hypothetical protein
MWVSSAMAFRRGRDAFLKAREASGTSMQPLKDMAAQVCRKSNHCCGRGTVCMFFVETKSCVFCNSYEYVSRCFKPSGSRTLIYSDVGCLTRQAFHRFRKAIGVLSSEPLVVYHLITMHICMTAWAFSPHDPQAWIGRTLASASTSAHIRSSKLNRSQ